MALSQYWGHESHRRFANDGPLLGMSELMPLPDLIILSMLHSNTEWLLRSAAVRVRNWHRIPNSDALLSDKLCG